MVSDNYKEGIRLYNAGLFYEAHEEWELAWRSAEGDLKLFYQGLIQAAAALLHHSRGNSRGAHVCVTKALQKLESLPASIMGLDLATYTGELRDFFAQNGRETKKAFPPLELQP